MNSLEYDMQKLRQYLKQNFFLNAKLKPTKTTALILAT